MAMMLHKVRDRNEIYVHGCEGDFIHKRLMICRFPQAVEAGEYEAVNGLLNAGAPVDYAFADGWTPLHIAADMGREVTTKPPHIETFT